MDKQILSDIEITVKALKDAIARSQSGIAGLISISKLGPAALTASAPNIFAELRQLEGEMQKFLKSYKDQLHKVSVSTSATTAKETE